MKSTWYLYMAILLCMLFPARLLPGQEVAYVHPLHAISFEATPNWAQELHDYNGKVFEVINPNHNMRIFLSYIPECKSVKKHMKELSGKKGLICSDRPYDTVLIRHLCEPFWPASG